MRDLDLLARGLRRHLANGSVVTHVSVLSAGHSNETYLVHGLDQILRMPPSGAPLLPCAKSVQLQFNIFAVMRGRHDAPPVPPLSYRCDDPDVLGAPFFLMERVPGVPGGDWGAPDWAEQGDDGFRRGIQRQAMEAVTRLHRMGPLDVMGPVLDNRGELDRWHGTVRDLDMPELHRLFDALRACAPDLRSPAACHGDPKMANMLWQDGRLVVVLDWEMSFNGDPRWDLAYMIVPLAGPFWNAQPGFEMSGFWRRDECIEQWQAFSRRSSESLLWFEAASRAKVAAILAYGFALRDRGLSNDPRFAGWNAVAAEYAALGAKLLAEHLKKPGL